MTPIKIHVMAKTLPAAKHRIATSLFPGSGMGRKSEKWENSGTEIKTV